MMPVPVILVFLGPNDSFQQVGGTRRPGERTGLAMRVEVMHVLNRCFSCLRDLAAIKLSAD
jgi:hypothetical protein